MTSDGGRGLIVRGWRDYFELATAESVVGLVSSVYRGRRNVMTATLFAESSHVPPLVRVSVASDSLSCDLIAKSGFFGLSILAQGQEALALRCGQTSGRDRPKDDDPGLRWTLTPSGVPIVTSCRAVSACRVVEAHPLGEHTLFVGDILESYRETRLDCRPTLRLTDVASMSGLA